MDPIMHTYGRQPVTFEKGEGVWLWDTEGKKYLDAVSGVAVCGLGHAHPAVTRALCQQAATLVHTSNLYQIRHQQTLAQKLTALSGMDNVFFGNSGAEANEAAIKIARKYGHQMGIVQPAIVVMENSFHGRTLATLTATGNRKVQAGFEPLVQGFVRVPYNDLAAVEVVAKNNPNVVAVLVEPAQGEGGVNIPDEHYLAGIRKICDKHHWLMMLDEIQTGMCRTGKWFAHQHEGITPDVMTLAKSLGNGIPIGACLAHGEAAQAFGPGNHGSTYGGNPLVCATALAVVETMEQLSLAQHAASMGEYMVSGLQKSLADHPHVKDIRGKGLMIGIELDTPCGELVAMARDRGVLINVTADKVIRLLPPLIITQQEADSVITTVCETIIAFYDSSSRVAGQD